MIDIFGGVLSGIKAFRSGNNYPDGRATAWRNLVSPGTWAEPIPSGAKAVEYFVMGGGSGGTNSGAVARGGAGAGLAFGRFNLTSGATTLTAIVAADAASGAAGNSSSLSDGTITKSATGGASGGGTGGTGSGGDTNRTGGVAGIASTDLAATGGASPGSPWGDGKNSGAATGAAAAGNAASGGATVFFASGSATATAGMSSSGGAGQGGVSGDCTNNQVSGGGGAAGPSAAGGTAAGRGWRATLTGVVLSDLPLILMMGTGRGSDGVSASNGSDATNGGGTGGIISASSHSIGAAGFHGAGGGITSTASVATGGHGRENAHVRDRRRFALPRRHFLRPQEQDRLGARL